MKRVLAALSGSSKKSTEKARRRLEAQENADSPLVPKRLLSPTPFSGLRGRSGSLALADVNGTVSGSTTAHPDPAPVCTDPLHQQFP